MNHTRFSTYILAGALALSGVGHASATTEDYIFGTYNVRIATDTEALKKWDDRKGNVARTITDIGFDAVGLTEVLDGAQRSDLEALLPDYDSRFSLVYSGGGKKQMNGVMWRRERFDALESGMFYLSPDAASASVKFPGASQSRGTAWVKLQDKSDGSIFYFFCCHMNRHEHAVAQKEGSRVITEQIRAIAGNYPCIFTGDMNSLADEVQVAGILKSYLASSQEIAKEKPSEPLITLNFWISDPNNKYQFDYAYVRDFEVESCHTFNQTYGLDMAPSDHIPFYIQCHPAPKNIEYRSIHVAPGGDLSEAVTKACSGDTIRLAAGRYEVPQGGLKMDKSLTILGGLDSNFATPEGISEITGDGSGSVLSVEFPFYLELRNCAISGGSGTDGGGICARGVKLDIAECTINGNKAVRSGGIYCEGDLFISRSDIRDNEAEEAGGGIFTPASVHWRQSISESDFSGNKAASGAASYVQNGRRSVWMASSVHDNVAGTDAMRFDSTISEGLATMVNCTIAENDGGITANLSGEKAKISLVNCTVARNRSASAAVIATAGELNLHNNIIIDNTGGDYHGDGNVTEAYNIVTADNAAPLLGEPAKNTIGTLYLPVLAETYGGQAVNALPYRELCEYVIGADCDDDFRATTFTYLSTDQNGKARPEDGTATCGAVEYEKTGAARLPMASDAGVAIRYGDGAIAVCVAAESVREFRISDPAGRVLVQIERLDRGVHEIKTGNLGHGIYVASWTGGSLKIRY